jgi:hypothetical protein
MARDIRMAGFVSGAGSATGFSDGTTTFAISGFNYALNPINSAAAPDALTVVLGVDELGVVQSTAGTLVTLDNNVDPSNTFIAFDLQPGMLYQSVPDGTNLISVTNFPSGDTTVGGKAYGVQAITYQVQNGTLQRAVNAGTPQPMAGDGETTVVEDLQFAYQVDGDTNWYNDPATDFPVGKSQVDIEMVRINVTVRTAVEDATVQDEVPTAQFNQPALEDHTASLTGPDGFRRRVYTTEVKVRNL